MNAIMQDASNKHIQKKKKNLYLNSFFNAMGKELYKQI